MRRQYHSHKTDKGTLIWDVHRLIEISRDLPVINVSLESIKEMEERSWFNDSDGPPSCKEVAFHAKLIEDTDEPW